VFDWVEVRELQRPFSEHAVSFWKTSFRGALNCVLGRYIVGNSTRHFVFGMGEHNLLRDIFFLLMPLMRCRGLDTISTKGAPYHNASFMMFNCG
jgi:hypothetical protein